MPSFSSTGFSIWTSFFCKVRKLIKNEEMKTDKKSLKSISSECQLHCATVA